MQARTIEPGSVCDGRLAKGRPYVLRRDNYNKQPSLALPHHWSKKSVGVIYQKFHGGWNGCNVTEQRAKFFIPFLPVLFLSLKIVSYSHVRILFHRLIFYGRTGRIVISLIKYYYLSRALRLSKLTTLNEFYVSLISHDYIILYISKEI